MKKVAIGVGAVVLVVLAVALLAPVFIDLNDFKPQIAREVEAATGRKLVITGDIDARVLPSPGASVARYPLRQYRRCIGREHGDARLCRGGPGPRTAASW